MSNVIWRILSTPPLCQALSKRFNPSLNIEVVSDAVIALVAGAGMRHGIVAHLRDRAVVYGETVKGQKIKVGGWGHLLDEGSGYEIGRIALKEVLEAYDVSGKTTLLAQKILNVWNLSSMRDIVNHIYREATNQLILQTLQNC